MKFVNWHMRKIPSVAKNPSAKRIFRQALRFARSEAFWCLGFDRGLARTLRMSSDLKIGFLGAGKMAAALAKGFLGAKLVNSDRLMASDPVEAARIAFTKE